VRVARAEARARERDAVKYTLAVQNSSQIAMLNRTRMYPEVDGSVIRR